MSKQLYEEALADVKKLKEVAEDNAKKALLEAVTPRIRDLIENQLIGEMSEEEADQDDLLFDDALGTTGTPADFTASFDVTPDSAALDNSLDVAMSPPDEEGKVTLDLDALQQSFDASADADAGEEFELTSSTAGSLGGMVPMTPTPKISRTQFESRMRKTTARVKALAEASRRLKASYGYSKGLTSTLNEVEGLYEQLQETFKSSPNKAAHEALLENCYTTLKKLMEQKMMKRKNRFLNEEDVTLTLTGLPDDIDLDSVGAELVSGGGGGDEEEEAPEGDEEVDLDLDDEGGEEEGGDDEGDEEIDLDLGDEEEEKKEESRMLGNNTVVEISESMLRREISRMKSLREEDETKAQSWGNGPGDVSDDFEDEDMGDPFVDIELTESDEELDEMVDGVDAAKKGGDKDDEKNQGYMDESDEDLDESDEDLDEAEDVAQYGGRGGRDAEQTNVQSRQVESIRRRLQSEARLQAEAKQKAGKAKKGKQQAEQQAKQKGKQATEAQKKGQKAKANQAKREQQQQKKKSQQMSEAYSYFARKYNESVTRSNRLRGMLAEATSRSGRTLNGTSSRSAAETSNLRSKLAETNLNNAKLAYANKLLQNESLTKRQKAEVLERLDEARTSREAKLVYESVTRSLAAVTPRRLAEGVSAIGSASRATRPASAPLNEGFETDRWARLAGITK